MIRARRLPDAAVPSPIDDPAILAGYAEDASGAPPGVCRALVRPDDEAGAAAFLRHAAERGWTVLPQAARSSLTEGAIPHGEVVLSVERMREQGPVEGGGDDARVRVQPGVRLRELSAALAACGFYYPPVPTYQEAMIGGVVSTNAGGAATFKYGVTRDWVEGLRVLLFNGDLLELERGETTARPGERFRVGLSDGRELSVPVPGYRLPAVRKISAGYHAADPLDLVDLFVGAEGTLGLITGVTLRLVALPPATLTGLVFCGDADTSLRLAARLCDAARNAREKPGTNGPDLRAVEWLDRRMLSLLRGHGDARRLRIEVPAEAGAALIFEMELDRPAGDEELQDALAAFLDGQRRDQPLDALCRILDDHGVLDSLTLAFPADERRHRALSEFREAAPLRVNELLAAARARDPAVRKLGGDLAVPFDRLAEMLGSIERAFAGRELDYAVWGHLADGNLHPNAIAADAAGVERGWDALLELGREAVRMGGSPLSEHGVGRSPIKQRLMRQFLGDGAVAEMRRIKLALDPDGRFAPGVLFPPKQHD